MTRYNTRCSQDSWGKVILYSITLPNAVNIEVKLLLKRKFSRFPNFLFRSLHKHNLIHYNSSPVTLLSLSNRIIYKYIDLCAAAAVVRFSSVHGALPGRGMWRKSFAAATYNVHARRPIRMTQIDRRRRRSLGIQ
jgi:hypothetical protein